MKKSFVSLLSVLFVFTILPSYVGAQEEPEATEETTVEDVTTNTDKKVKSAQVSFCEGVDGEKIKKLDLGTVDPGDEIEICIAVDNYNDVPITVNTYFVDGLINPITPDFIACKTKEEEKETFAKYIKFEDDQEEKTFEIAPKTSSRIKAYLEFPENVGGSIYGCLATETGERSVEKGVLNVVTRNANIIEADVTGTGIVDPAFEDFSEGEGGTRGKLSRVKMNGKESENIDGERYVIMGATQNMTVVHDKVADKLMLVGEYVNVGNTTIELKNEISVKSDLGYANTFNENEIIMPGESKDIEIILEEGPFYGGAYTVVSKLNYSQRANPGEESIEGKTTEETYKLNFYITPWDVISKALIVLAIVLVIAVIAIYAIKKKKMVYNVKTKAYTVKSGDSISSIAEKCDCDWKMLAKINNLKPPYHLEKGDKIKVIVK